MCTTEALHVSEPSEPANFTGRMLTGPARLGPSQWFFKIIEPGTMGRATLLPLWRGERLHFR